jgi:hypothetical protein
MGREIESRWGTGWQILKNTDVNANVWATFFHGTRCVLILSKKWFGNILGDFFTNSSGTDVMIF